MTTLKWISGSTQSFATKAMTSTKLEYMPMTESTLAVIGMTPWRFQAINGGPKWGWL